MEESEIGEGRYGGNKWGGRYLRAPEIFFRILEKGVGKLVKLGEIAEVKRGFTTGANEFFYLEPVGISVKEVAELSEREPRRLVRVRNGAGWEGEIEAGWLKPVVRSLREVRGLQIRPEELRYLIFMTPDDVREAMEKGRKKFLEYLRENHPKAFDYIQWGEKQGYQERPTCRSREWWWDVGERQMSDVLYSYMLGERHLVPVNRIAYADCNLFDLYSKKAPAYLLTLLMTSPLFRLLLELRGREMTGALTVLKVQVYELEPTLILNPLLIPPSQRARLISAFERLAQREVRSIFEELGFAICRERGCQNPEHPYEFVNPKALTLEQVRKASPDRFELDSVVFDILGLTDEERLEVYKAVADLVKSRLTKARSV
jgi:hypothetical protein